jgi:hypothetical protein
MILPLVAIENLFKVVEGKKHSTGKKCNINYLNKYIFRLNQKSSLHMVIKPTNIYFI